MSTPTTVSVADDAEIVRRILAHIDAGTTDEGDAWREPVENYLNPIRFTAEVEMLRTIRDVVRKGYVQRITRDAIVCDEASIPADPDATGPGWRSPTERASLRCGAAR